MKAKHTPGPWKVVNHVVGIDGLAIMAPDAGYRYVASALNISTDGYQEANARLIAAAPDMLSALEYIAFHAPRAKSKEEMEGCLETVLSVIKRAKGEV